MKIVEVSIKEARRACPNKFIVKHGRKIVARIEETSSGKWIFSLFPSGNSCFWYTCENLRAALAKVKARLEEYCESMTGEPVKIVSKDRILTVKNPIDSIIDGGENEILSF